ncbi:PPC domain-containing DNA-binding protein [Pelagibius sp. Alg239-R121]|uniref:PPC domain-containing DNA-binding protein n=1 Tax=Pelagibius sp. Alg239-R121 TaxID=2993448 RepID=UPI0024A72C66|nr:PPC domain-containing DNA-binding protein [Pelagibius sp. Alg239-R121]
MTELSQSIEGKASRRRVTQPGAPLSPRRLCVWAETGQELRLILPEGADLLKDLAAALSARGIKSAAIQMLSGSFGRVSYFTGMIDATGARVATYGAPRELSGPVMLLGANAVFGRSEAGEPLVHCHAVMVDTEGRVHGGHLPLEGCILGTEGAVIMIAPLEGAGFEVSYDSETNYSLFHPTASVPVN